MAGFETLAVALSCKESDDGLIRYASLLARLGATREIRFVHVLPDTKHSPPAAEVRERMREKVSFHFYAPALTGCDVLQGPPTDRLLSYVNELQADLIVVGAERRVMGCRLAMLSASSVAIVPENAPARISHIAVAVDFSSTAAAALQWVTSLAAGDRTIRCTAMHVITHESADLFADQEAEPRQAEMMNKILASADLNGVSLETRLTDTSSSPSIGRSHRFFMPTSIEGADIAKTILDDADAIHADCIALSTRGRSASASILLGSVTEKVIERSHLPLLVSKLSGASLSFTEALRDHMADAHAVVKTN